MILFSNEESSCNNDTSQDKPFSVISLIFSTFFFLLSSFLLFRNNTIFLAFFHSLGLLYQVARQIFWVSTWHTKSLSLKNNIIVIILAKLPLMSSNNGAWFHILRDWWFQHLSLFFYFLYLFIDKVSKQMDELFILFDFNSLLLIERLHGFVIRSATWMCQLELMTNIKQVLVLLYHHLEMTTSKELVQILLGLLFKHLKIMLWFLKVEFSFLPYEV